MEPIEARGELRWMRCIDEHQRHREDREVLHRNRYEIDDRLKRQRVPPSLRPEDDGAVPHGLRPLLRGEEIDEECVDHAHSTEAFNNNSILLASFIFLIAISVHNIPEGLSLGINFNVSGAEIPYQGIIMSIILFIHNFLIGFTMCNSFLHSNKSFKFALSLTTFSALPAFILAICGYFISTISLDQVFLGVIFAISTGSLLYVLFIELLPQVFKEYKSKYTYLYILLGIVLCGILLYVFGHHH